MSLERQVIQSNVWKSYLGMLLATGLAIYGLYIAKEIAVGGNPATAGVIAPLDIGGLISVAVYSIRVQRKEREKRQETSSAPPS